MRRIAALAMVALVGAGVPAGAAPEVASVPEGIVRLLEAHATAWKTHDRAMLERTVRPALRSQMISSLANASGLLFDTYTLRPTTQFSGDLAGERIRGLYPGLQVAMYQVSEETRIGGYDLVPFLEDAFVTFVREGPDSADMFDGWRIASRRDLEPLAAYSPRTLWDGGPVRSESSEHFLLLAHPDVIGRGRAMLDRAETAYAKARSFWPARVGERYVIVVPSTTDELGDMIQATIDLDKFVAFAAASITTDEGFKPAGVRIFLHISHFQRYNADGQITILAHELLHAFTRPVAGPFIPAWVEEGLAMFGTEPENKPAARRAPRARFPTDDEFSLGSTGQIVTRYRQAQSAMAELVARSGAEGLAKFYESLGSARVAPGTDTYHVERALREALGWSVADWTRAWQQRLG